MSFYLGLIVSIPITAIVEKGKDKQLQWIYIENAEIWNIKFSVTITFIHTLTIEHSQIQDVSFTLCMGLFVPLYSNIT